MAAPAPSVKPGLPEGFDVNRPQRGARDGYYQLWLEMNKEYMKIIANMGDKRYDARIPRMVRHMIASITDDSIRLYAWNLFDSTMYNIRKKTPELSVEERSELIMDMCDVILGEIGAFYDQFAGVTHRLRMGNAKPPEGMEDDNGELPASSEGTTSPEESSPFGVPDPTDVVDVDV